MFSVQDYLPSLRHWSVMCCCSYNNTLTEYTSIISLLLNQKINTDHPYANIPDPSNLEPPPSHWTATYHQRISRVHLSLKSSRLPSGRSLLLLGASRRLSAVWTGTDPSFPSGHCAVCASLAALIEMTVWFGEWLQHALGILHLPGGERRRWRCKAEKRGRFRFRMYARWCPKSEGLQSEVRSQSHLLSYVSMGQRISRPSMFARP